MKIEEVRTSFTIYVIATKLDRVDGMAESLALAGYMVVRFNEITAAFSEFFSNPPHLILFDFEESGFDLNAVVTQVGAQLPETHILIAAPVALREKAVEAFADKVYDLIFTPVLSSNQLVRSFDRASERDYFMYMNEQLINGRAPGAAAAALPVEPATSPQMAPDLEPHFAAQLLAMRSEDECLEFFMQAISRRLGGCGSAYFKYIPNRRVLIAAKGENLNGVDLKGLGVNFNEVGRSFRSSHLHDPHSLPEISNMMRDVFGQEDFFAMPVDVLGETQGLLFFLIPPPEGEVAALLRDAHLILEKAMNLIEAEKRLHVLSIKDQSTDLVNRVTFINKITEEVSRSRRSNSPLSLVLIAVDQYGGLVSQCGAEEAQIVLRMMARIFEKHSRVNDVIGRTASDEFGLLLPHTGRKGAMIKAERIRRIIETADFSRVVSAFPQFTISLGVSEYPSLVRDAEELLQSADEALMQVRGNGNKTCAATAPDGFVADFSVQEKGL